MRYVSRNEFPTAHPSGWPNHPSLPREKIETRAGEDCGLLGYRGGGRGGGRAQLRLRVGRFFPGDTPKSSVIWGDPKDCSRWCGFYLLQRVSGSLLATEPPAAVAEG